MPSLACETLTARLDVGGVDRRQKSLPIHLLVLLLAFRATMSSWRPLTLMLFRISSRIAPALRCAIGMPRTNSRRALRGLQIFEVDHPSSQAWKRAHLAKLGMEAPPTLRYVSIDFECETLTARLDVGGVDRKAKAFFSWLGVTQYLTRDAVLKACGR